MKHDDRLVDILSWILEGQSEPVRENQHQRTPTAERMQDALTAKRPFDLQERSVLLRSPTARGRFRFLTEAHRAEQLVKWRELAIEESLALQAAAGGPLEPISISNNDFSLTLLPLDEQGREWMLHLKLASRLVTVLRAKPLAVRDGEGKIWLSGSPDNDGELSGPWVLGGSPVDRLNSTRLFIEPM